MLGGDEAITVGDCLGGAASRRGPGVEQAAASTTKQTSAVEPFGTGAAPKHKPVGSARTGSAVRLSTSPLR
jgi:hypothetical protein